jgi:predicted nucleic acid-binding protein
VPRLTFSLDDETVETLRRTAGRTRKPCCPLRMRDRDMDLAIAACAIEHRAALWTLNRAAFADIPDLRLFDPAR